MFSSTMPLFALLGVLAGVLSGLLGIGGGVILVPILVFIFGFSEHLAQGTTLALMVPPIGLLAAWSYYKKGHVDLRIAALVCFGFAIGGLLGAKLAAVMSNALLEKMFAAGLILIAIKMIFAPDSTARPSLGEKIAFAKRRINVRTAMGLVLLGLFVGAFSGLLGIGGGVILVPALVFLFGLSQHEAQGTTLALMVPPIGLLAAWQYHQEGNINIVVAGLICLGFFFGALWGAKLATSMSSKTLAKIFGIGMLLIAVKMLLP